MIDFNFKSLKKEEIYVNGYGDVVYAYTSKKNKRNYKFFHIKDQMLYKETTYKPFKRMEW